MKNAKLLLSIFKVRARYLYQIMDLIGCVDEMPLSPESPLRWDDRGGINNSIAYTQPVVRSPHFDESNSLALLLSPTRQASSIFFDRAPLRSVAMEENDQPIQPTTPNSLAELMATNMDDIVMSEEIDQTHHQAATPVSSQEPLSSDDGDVVMSNDKDNSVGHSNQPFTTPTEFLLFPQLPIELRGKIIDENLPGPRLVELITVQVKERETIRDEFLGFTTEPVVNRGVSQEWRNRSLKQYPLSFSVDGEEPMIPFNCEIDALYIGPYLGSTNAIKFKRQCRQWELASIKHLVVNSKINWGVRRWDSEIHGYDRGK